MPMTACESAAGGLGPEAPENNPPAESPVGCFPPSTTSCPALNSNGCNKQTQPLGTHVIETRYYCLVTWIVQ